MKTQQQSAKRGAGLQSGEGSVAQRGAGSSRSSVSYVAENQQKCFTIRAKPPAPAVSQSLNHSLTHSQ
jgi:hypothetical protein